MKENFSNFKELTVEESINLAVSKINTLLKKKKYVVIAISGSGINVGKTFISSKLADKLSSHKVCFRLCSELNNLNYNPFYREEADKYILLFSSESTVINKKDLAYKNK